MEITKSNLFIILFTLTTICNTYTMDQPESKQKKSSKLKQFKSWVNNAANVLLGKEQMHITSFNDLAIETKREIIILLGAYSDYHTLDRFAYAIKSLSLVNHELNNLINDPQFCFQLIKSLSNRFNTSCQCVCQRLQTPAAKERLKLQLQLYDLCSETNPSEQIFEDLCNKDIDLEFTYNCCPKKKNFLIVRPLMICAALAKPIMMSYLIKKNVSIDAINASGDTALMICVRKIEKYNDTHQALACFKMLMDANANLDIKNNQNDSPRSLIKSMEDPEVDLILKNAIDKRNKEK